MSNLLSVTEYAELYGKHPANVRKLVQVGRIPAQKVGNQWVIDADTPYPEDKRVKSGKYKNWRKPAGE